MNNLKKTLQKVAVATVAIGALASCATVDGFKEDGLKGGLEGAKADAKSAGDTLVRAGSAAKTGILELEQSMRNKFEKPEDVKNLQRFLVQEGCLAQRQSNGKSSVDGLYKRQGKGYGQTQKAYENELSEKCGTSETFNFHKKYPQAESELDSSSLPFEQTKVAAAVNLALKPAV